MYEQSEGSWYCSVGVLKVEAMASTDVRPLDGFTPRKGQGISLFGKSSIEPPVKDNMRIDFQFDKAAFDFKCDSGSVFVVSAMHHITVGNSPMLMLHKIIL